MLYVKNSDTLSKKEIIMLRKIFKEISRFILSVFICILGCYIFVNFFCGDFHLSTSSCPNGVFCVIREHALFCNIRVPSMIFLGITFLVELLQNKACSLMTQNTPLGTEL